ncbi:hypothetical protein RM844_30150 [Streptomyces sp. DSM 44915]|uniref:Uncharacterized protein n=1 Tax=Streptomyces chisholmiae TaxID=3075540 RepID=A0ABU2JZW7_9ACTN|nr:hypothetical protein [Streptomyces sp. DSM 44915]MDT0270543.1 hypothetical protein [Streptomyces sp. DSM 44915]
MSEPVARVVPIWVHRRYRGPMHPMLKTHVNGELVELPGTIAAVRETLPAEERDEFTREAETTPAPELVGVLARWALRGTAADAEDEDVFRRLERGDHGGCVPADDEAAGAA